MNNTTESFYKVYDFREAVQTFNPDSLQALNKNVEDEVNTLDREEGLGIFIRHDLKIDPIGQVNFAIVAAWNSTPKRKVRKVKYMAYHVFTGDVPDQVLDAINYVAANTIDSTWKK